MEEQKTNIEIQNNKKTNGGDESRRKTSIILISLLIPLLLIASISPLLISNNIIPILFEFYLIVFMFGAGAFIFLAVHEIVNFTIPKKEDYKSHNVILFTLFTFMLIMWISFSIHILKDNGIVSIIPGFFTKILSPLTILAIGTLVYFSITAIFPVDFKHVLISYFVSILFYFFITSLSSLILLGGWQVIILIITMVVLSDTMAYYGGKKWGKTKIFPEVSPNKTLEGFLTGLFSSIAFGLIFFLIFFTWDSGFNNSILISPRDWKMLLIVPLIALVAPFGDLTFSKVKRSYNKKDYSNLLPGHGGIFDRLDSHIFAISTAFLLMSIIL